MIDRDWRVCPCLSLSPLSPTDPRYHPKTFLHQGDFCPLVLQELQWHPPSGVQGSFPDLPAPAACLTGCLPHVTPHRSAPCSAGGSHPPRPAVLLPASPCSTPLSPAGRSLPVAGGVLSLRRCLPRILFTYLINKLLQPQLSLHVKIDIPE